MISLLPQSASAIKWPGVEGVSAWEAGGAGAGFAAAALGVGAGAADLVGAAAYRNLVAAPEMMQRLVAARTPVEAGMAAMAAGVERAADWSETCCRVAGLAVDGAREVMVSTLPDGAATVADAA